MYDKAAQAITEAIEEIRKEIHEMLGKLAQLEAARRVLVGATSGRGGSRSAKVQGERSRRASAHRTRRKPSGSPAKKDTRAAAPKRTVKPKRKISATARQALSARMKAKWAAYRAQKAA